MFIQRTLPYLQNSGHYFEQVRSLGHAVYLDSGYPLCPWGRFDIITAAPEKLLELDSDNSSDAFHQLEVLYKQYQYEPEVTGDLPFYGGLIGHFSYDLGRRDALLSPASHNLLPDMRVGLYLWAVVTDHKTENCYLVADARLATDELDKIEALLLDNTTESEPVANFKLTSGFKANMNSDEYDQKLHAIDDYIHAGDCYQVNFSQQFEAGFEGDPWQAYKLLRQAAPTPYSAYIETEQDAILSLSPEQFLELKEGKVTTKPIKGTRPRSSIPGEDIKLKEELANSEKDRAENLMIVDLLRNDLGRVCQYGSVKAPKLFNIESYANVHHKVSTVTGTLAEKNSPVELLHHCFPGGSITGAPKIRAMQIIDELEPHQRSIYCGSIGYISLCGQMDTSITIRTLLCHKNKLYCWAGGGIVADSTTQAEYEETFNKVDNLLNCLEGTR